MNGKGTVKMGEMTRELPFLAASLRESMRLFPVVGVPFPRVVGDEGLLIDEVEIPAGVSPAPAFFPNTKTKVIDGDVDDCRRQSLGYEPERRTLW